MVVTANYRYDAVRFSPVHSENYPFQIISSAQPLRENPLFQVVTEMTVEEAVDLHHSLGVMILGVKNG